MERFHTIQRFVVERPSHAVHVKIGFEDELNGAGVMRVVKGLRRQWCWLVRGWIWVVQLGKGFSGLAAAFALSILMLPTVTRTAEEMLKHDPARALAPVQAVQDTGRQALVEMKRLVGVLKDVGEDDDRAPQPRLADLDELAAKLRDAGQRVEVRIEGEPRDLPLGIELSAYRVVQEALTNTLKHAGGAPVVATLRYGADELAIRGVDAIEHHAYAGADRKFAAGMLSDDLAHVLVIGIAVAGQRIDGDEAFDEQIFELHKQAVLGRADHERAGPELG